MSEQLEKGKFEQLVQRINPGNKLLRTWELKGGISAQVTAMEVMSPHGKAVKMIVRQHGTADLRRNPHIAADEFKLLQMLKILGLPVPSPYFFDETCKILSSPYIVIGFVEGETELNPDNVTDYIAQLASNLAKVHLVDGKQLDFSFLPIQEDVFREMLENSSADKDDSLHKGFIKRVLKSVWPLPSRNKHTLLHG
ncbi:MAG TPA: phosphotransferase, partial [Bacillaceae bacterium]